MATPDFLQVRAHSSNAMHKARRVLKRSAGEGSQDPRINLISMAMRGKKANFNKVLVMMDKMIGILGQEQIDDGKKKSYCTQEFDKTEDEGKVLAEQASDYKKTIANAKEMLDTITEDISKAAAGIKALNKAVAEATKQRKAENDAFVEELASNGAAIQILNIAKDRLAAFYNPELAKAQPQPSADASSLQQVATAAPQAPSLAQEAFSFLQASQGVAKAAPPPAPAGFSKPDAKQDSSGIITLLNTLIQDTEKTVTEMKVEEKDTQFEYEQLMAESSAKHAAEAKAISAKESAKAEKEAELQKLGSELKATNAEAEANSEYLQGLHKECDWLLKNFKVRQDARASEIDSLKQSKAVLKGADVSFLQMQQETAVKHNLRKSLV
jgi:hypothetical protein